MKTNNIKNSINLTRKRLYTHQKPNTSLCRESNKLYNTYSKQNKTNKGNSKLNIVKNYNKYLDGVINNFCKQNKNLLTHIYNIKKSTNIQITYKTFNNLDKTEYSIPPFTNIFRDLVSNDHTTFTNKFTQEELQELKSILNPSNNIHNASILNKGKIYAYLDKHKLGNKLGDIFYTQLNTNTLPDSIINNYPSLQFYKLLINDFTSFNVIQNIEKYMNMLIVYSFTYNGVEYQDKLYIYLDQHKTNITPKYLQTLGHNVIQRMLFYNSFLNTTAVPKRFIIFLTDLEKEIDNQLIENHHFKTNNVNSAVTNKEDIIIYRKQEILKSIFHELTHFHSLDFMNIPSNIVNDLIKTHHIKQENTYLLYESATETLANILNNIYLSSNIKIFKNNLKSEIKYSTLQIAKILKVLNYEKLSDFANADALVYEQKHTSNVQKKTNTKFTQDSCMFSYYILKTYILINLDTYFKNCLDSKLHFIKTDQGFSNLLKIFNSARYNTSLKNIIDLFIENLPTYTTGKDKHTTKLLLKQKKIYKTLRMTCLDPTFL
jgi:hypothetical protein